MTASSERQPLRLAETFRNLFYTPIYVAVAGGFLDREGLDVTFSTAPAGRLSIDMLSEGTADILQTGLSRSFMALDRGVEDAPLHVAEINQRDGFFIVAHDAAADWKWGDLEGKTLVPVGFTPVPGMSLKYVMKGQGVEIDSVRLVEGLSAQDAIEYFKSGRADYIQMPNPQAQQLVDDGSGHIVTAIGASLGYMSYSSFAVSPSYLDSNADVVRRFVRGFYNGQQWLATTDAGAVAAMVKPFFPDTAEAGLERSIRRYKQEGTWATDPLIRRVGFTTMRDVLMDGGLVSGRYAYERLVRPEFAEEIVGA